MTQRFCICCLLHSSVCRPDQPALEEDPAPRESVLQFEEDLDLLPLRDVAVSSHGGDLTQQFGFTIGPVCFS